MKPLTLLLITLCLVSTVHAKPVDLEFGESEKCRSGEVCWTSKITEGEVDCGSETLTKTGEEMCGETNADQNRVEQ